MKPLIFSLAALSISCTISAQSGKLNVTFYGIVCHQQTNDDLLGLDGIGDEVYCSFTSGYTLRPNTNSSFKHGSTKIMGERSALMSTSEYYSREKAGTVSVNGGLKTGDQHISANKISIFQNLAVDRETVLFILPSIWEEDKRNVIPDPRSSYRQIAGSVAASATFNAQVRNEISSLDANTLNSRSYIMDARRFGVDAQMVNTFKHIGSQLQSKPVGMNSSLEFNGKVVVLNAALCESLAQKDYGYGRGVVPVLYSDAALGYTASNGIYSILIHFQYTPDPVTASPTPVVTQTVVLAPADSTRKVSISNTRLNTSTNLVKGNNPLVGTWTGTYQAEKGKSHYYAIRIMADNTLQVLDENGKMIGSGSYAIKDKQLTGTYNYTRDRNTYHITASVNGRDMKGTWGDGNTGTGDFSLVKNN